MKRFLRAAFSSLLLVIVSSFGLVTHVSAMPASMHQMEHGSSSHSQHSHSASSVRCVTLCTSAVVQKEDEYDNEELSEDDDEPAVPYYLEFSGNHFDELSTRHATTTTTVKPPPKVPIYLQHAVLRF